LGNDTLMPLLGVVMTPVTLAFGPSASYNLLVIVAPGLAAYAMYRAARLWLPSRIGAIAAGAFFGLSGMLASQDWQHLHTAMGCVFLPLPLGAAVRLRRGPTLGRGIVVGLVLGAAVLVDQEAALLAAILAAFVLVPWLARRPGVAGLRAVVGGGQRGPGSWADSVYRGPPACAARCRCAGERGVPADAVHLADPAARAGVIPRG
jgi:hypothetical protein